MAQDMWTLINRELAKLEKARAGVPDTSYAGVIKEAMESGMQQRAWKERKNLQRQELMGRMAQGTKMTFNQKDLESKKNQLQIYFNKYQGQFDDETMELGQMYLNEMDEQKEKNIDFGKSHGQLDEMSNWMQENISQIGTELDAEGNKVDRTLNTGDLKLIEEMNATYLDYRSNFIINHADRLSLKPYQHIATQLDAGKKMNTFLLEQAEEDNLIDSEELKAWNKSWDEESLRPIQVYRQKQTYNDTVIAEKTTKDLMSAHDEYTQLDAWIKGTGVIDIAPEGGKARPMTYGQVMADYPDLAASYKMRLEALHNPRTDSGLIKNLNERYKDKMAIGYLEDQGIELPVTSPEEREEFEHIEKIKELTGITLPEKRELVEGEYPLTEAEVKTADKFKIDMEKHYASQRSLVKKGTDIVSDMAPYIPAVYFTGKMAAPFVNKAKHFIGSQVTKSLENLKALAGLKPQQAVDWMGDKTVQKQVGKAQALQDNLKNALKTGGPKSKAVIEATKNLDDYVDNTVKKLMTKPKFKGMSVDQMTKLLKDTKKWSTLKLLAGAYNYYPGLRQWFNKGGFKAFIPGGAYAGFRTLMVAGEKVGDPTGGLGTAATGIYLYNKVKKSLTKQLSTKAGQKALLKKLPTKIASIVAKRIAVSAGVGAAAGGPLAGATALIGGLVGAGWALYDIVDLFVVYPWQKEEEEE